MNAPTSQAHHESRREQAAAELASDYVEWESAITEQLAERLYIPYGDAAAILEAQPFLMAHAWGRDDSPADVAAALERA